MQIEEGFRDMKSTRFGLGFEQNNSVKPARLSILILLTTLASLAVILLGMVLSLSLFALITQTSIVKIG